MAKRKISLEHEPFSELEQQTISGFVLSRIISSPEDGRTICTDIVRCGKRVDHMSILTELAFKHLGVIKDASTIEHLRENRVPLSDGLYNPIEAFQKLFPQVSPYRYSDAQLFVDWSFGKGIHQFVDLSQYILNQTGMQRVGGEELNDAFIAVHSLRAAGNLYSRGANPYQSRLALFHDVIEDVEKWRRVQRASKMAAKDEFIGIARKIQDTGSEVYNKVIAQFDTEIRALELDIENPPEWDLVLDLFASQYSRELRDERRGRAMADLSRYHISLLTKKQGLGNEEGYPDYTKRLIDGSSDGHIADCLNYANLDPLLRIGYTEAPLTVKAGETKDNTERLREANISMTFNRLEHNLIFLAGLDEWLEANKDASPLLRMLRSDLYTQSMVELNFNHNNRYKGDPNPHVKNYMGMLEELRKGYEQLRSQDTGMWDKIMSILPRPAKVGRTSVLW